MKYPVLTLGIFFCLATPAAKPPLALHFHFETSESSTAIYHVACLAGNIPCTKANFEKFWHTTQAWTSADQAELDAWSAIFRKIADAALPAEPSPYIGNSAALTPSVSTQHRVIREALEARNLADFQGRTWQWIESEDSASLYRVIAHFRARLHPSERKEVKVLLPRIEKEMRKIGAPALAEQMAHFTEANLPTGDVYLHLVPGPIFDSDTALATPISNHAFMEVTSKAAPAPAASILLRELTHYFYDNASARQHAALMQQFAQSGVTDSSSFYAFLPEAIAGPSTSTDNQFTARLNRSTMLLLKNGTLFQPQFVKAYIDAATRELGPDLRDPRFVLKSAAYSVTEKAHAAYELFAANFHPASGNWQFFPNQNLVFLAAYDEWGTLPDSIPELKPFASKRGFAYVAPGNGGRTICVIAGRDSEAIVEAVNAFAKLKSLPTSGLVVSIE